MAGRKRKSSSELSDSDGAKCGICWQVTQLKYFQRAFFLDWVCLRAFLREALLKDALTVTGFFGIDGVRLRIFLGV